MVNQWVYNRNTDLSLFGGAVLFALALSLIFPETNFLSTFYVYVFIDITHSITTYFFTLTSDRINNSHHKYFFWGIPFLVYALNCLMVANGLYQTLFKLYALASVYHFMKQSQAWIIISSKKTKPKSKLEDRVNMAMSYCAVWTPQIMSMTLENPKPWFIPGDIFKLPLIFKDISIIVSSIILFTYIVIEIKRWRDSGLILWGKHFHILVGFIVWSSARLLILSPLSPTLGQLLMVSTHSFSYLYLAHRYIKTRREKNEKFWPDIKSHPIFLMWIIGACMLVTSTEYFYIHKVSGKSGYVLTIIFTIALTHYIYDAYLWKKETHPEGAEIVAK